MSVVHRREVRLRAQLEDRTRSRTPIEEAEDWPHNLIPIAVLSGDWLSRLVCEIPKGDVLLSDENLGHAGQWLARRAVVGTHREPNFIDRNILPGDTNSIQSADRWECAERFVALPGDTIATCPTLEPCSVEGIFLQQQIGKSSARTYPGLTMITLSILRTYQRC